MRGDAPDIQCALCERLVPRRLVTLHHLRPKDKGGTAQDRVPLCRQCHKQLHATFSNGELAHEYASLDALRGAERLQPFLKWIRKQKPGRNFRTVPSLSHPQSKRRRLAERRRLRA